jgi:PiT family inorganic phosphate transporter
MHTPISRLSLLRLFLVIAFLVGIALSVGLLFLGRPAPTTLILAALFGGYMAITIGANDAANNLGAAVGAKAISLIWALVVAVILEIAGAMIAGDNVMHTIKGGLIDPAMIGSQEDFVWLMLSALLAAAIWIHLATVMNAPISTTHAIIGGMVGAGVTAGGLEVTNWPALAAIASSWVISPLLGGLIAAAFLYLIKQTLTYQTNMTRAAKRVVPILVAVMGWAFSVYLMHKGLHQIWAIDLFTAVTSSLVIALGLYLITYPIIDQAADRLPQSKMAINTLFNIPLIFAAAILSFAHGTNDAANAIGPVAAIYEITQNLSASGSSNIPLWIILVGASGLGLGIVLYGPRLIKVVGYEITELDQIRAYSITMAIAITVILASELSLPVSTTHVTVGAVLGVGFLREYLKRLNAATREKITHHLSGKNLSLINRFLDEFYAASFLQKRVMLKQLETHSQMGELTKREHRELSKLYRKELVKRSTIVRIITAWVLTLPITGILASLIYLLIQRTL